MQVLSLSSLKRIWTVAAALTLTTVAGADTFYAEAREIETSFSISANGVYAVWLLSEGRETGRATLPGHGVVEAARGREDARGTYYWRKAGSLDLTGGEVVTVAELEKAAAIALSSDGAFDPQRMHELAKVLGPDERPADRRLTQNRGTNTVYTMPHYPNREAWERKARQLRRRMLVACGLWPLPEKTPLHAKVFDRYEGDGFTVEKVHFEAWPGFLVTGNLWRPVGKTEPVPGVVCPHGHWANGRLEDGDRGSVPARGITLARMGMVAFTYDMVGYVDSRQFSAHGFNDPKAVLWGIHPFALQLWSSIRAVDFLQSLPDVDADRIGCTGASGGGTQTFALYTVDNRIKVAAPVNMISSTMQGGCVCENAPYIRLDNSNMALGACMAPRPLLMVSATGDWTRETPRVEYPAIRSIYALYDAEGRVAQRQIDAPHNYNLQSRETMYRFFGQWLLEEEGWEDYTEPAYTLPSKDALQVFPREGAPEGWAGEDEVKATIKSRMVQRADALLASQKAVDRKPVRYRAAFRDIFVTPESGVLKPERRNRIVRAGYTVEHWVLHREKSGAAVPAMLYLPEGVVPQAATLLVHGDGKGALVDRGRGAPGREIAALLAEGRAVLAIDLFLTGEYNTAFAACSRTTDGFLDTFAPTDAACRVQDVLTACAFLDSRRDLAGPLEVVGLAGGGLPVLFAATLRKGLGRVWVDANGFDPADDAQWVERFNVPGLRALDDVRTAGMLLTAADWTIFNVPDGQDWRVPPARVSALDWPEARE